MPGSIHPIITKRKRRWKPVPAEVLGERFATYAEVEAYLAKDPLPCLICGKRYRRLANHLVQTHEVSRGDYNDRFGIPRKCALICASTKDILREHALEQGFGPDMVPEKLRLQAIAKRREGNGHKHERAPCIRERFSERALQRPRLCEGCGQNPADPPGKLCVGCEAYKDHQS